MYLANKLFDMMDSTEFLDCSISYGRMFGRPADPKRPWSRVLNLTPSSNLVVRFCEDAEDIRPLCGMELLQFLGLDPAYFPEECEEMSNSLLSVVAGTESCAFDLIPMILATIQGF